MKTKTGGNALAGTDGALIEPLVSTYEVELVAFARSRGAADPEGVVNEVFLRFFNRRDDLDFATPGRLRAYLFRIARNLITDEFRRRQSRPAAFDGLSSDLTDHRVDVEKTIGDLREVERLMGHLTTAEHEVVRLRYLEDLTIGETARRLDKPLGTVKSLQHHALRRMRAIALAVAVAAGVLIVTYAYQHSRAATSLQPVSSIDGDGPRVTEPSPGSPDRSPEADRSGPIEERPTTSLGLDAVESGSGTATPTAPSGTSTDSAAGLEPGDGQPAGNTPSTIAAEPANSAATHGGPSTTTGEPLTTSIPGAATPLPSGTIAIRSVGSGLFLTIRASDNSVRANAASSSAEATWFTIVQIDASTIALQASAGARQNLLGVQNDADNALRARGGSGSRPWLIAHRRADGTYRFESVLFPGRFLRSDGTSIDSGGTVSSGVETFFEVIDLETGR